jgi:uncharacterized RDD family membrane protein YckC
MESQAPDTDLIVATPERVSFDYQVAGLGTRAIAQALDLSILLGVLIAVFFVAVAAGSIGVDNGILTLVVVIGAFITVFGYFWVSEALWSGQTVGKKAFRLRVVGDRGEPLTFMQAGIRNIVRIVDFLPYAYGVGLVVLFVNGKGKRLGDLAAGTIVVKDSDHVWLWQLQGGRPVPPPTPPSAPAGAASPGTGPTSVPPPPPPPAQFAPATTAELTLRRLDPDLRRFVSSYARRRPQLSVELRVQLASMIQPSLQSAQPEIFAHSGPLAALDHLADLEGQ